MKTLGFCLLVAGWLLVLSALILLHVNGPRTAFILAGVAVEGLGVGIVVRSHLIPRKPERF